MTRCEEYERNRPERPELPTDARSVVDRGRRSCTCSTCTRPTWLHVGSGKWLQGVEYKAGSNGYVILPPGSHISGGRYRWRDGVLEALSAPQSLVESILSRSDQ